MLVDECILIRREDVGSQEDGRRKIEFSTLFLTALITILYLNYSMDSLPLVSFPNFTLCDGLKLSIRRLLALGLCEDHTGIFQQAYVSLYGSY
jgi:hypothetical protein